MNNIGHKIYDIQGLTAEKQKGFLEHVKILDTLEAQLKELAIIRNPHLPKQAIDYPQEISKILGSTPIEQYGNWIYYPWSNTLLRLLPEEEFIEVRTNRNKLKITGEEQRLLRTKRVGVVGLSVGHAIAHTLALERICGELHLADFDTLDLSNVNRIRTPLTNLGLKKTTIIQREIAEIDPYLRIYVYESGVNKENVEEFVNSIDLIIEVCDNIDVKLDLRFKARSLKLPLVMDTNDRGMVDIERFDLDSQRPIFHGLVDESLLSQIDLLDDKQKFQVLLQLVSFQDTSSRLKLSVEEIGKTISTWPQLASAVQIGAGVTCDVVRKILLGESKKSGRFYFDTENVVK